MVGYFSGGVGYLTVIVGVLVGYSGWVHSGIHYEIHVWIEWSERSERYLSFFIYFFLFCILFCYSLCKLLCKNWGGGGGIENG